MKKKRFFVILSLSFLIVFIFILSSPLFTLKTVSLTFYDDNNGKILIKNNKIYNTDEKINSILSSANFKYGSSLFLLDKKSYANRLESKNPYLKLLDVEAVFPNKLELKVKERKPFYYINNGYKYFLIDEDYKLLDIVDKYTFSQQQNLIKINVKDENDNNISFFDFFCISDKAFETGQYINENNKILNNIKDLSNIIKKFSFDNLIYEVEIREITSGNINLNIYTNQEQFGVVLMVENVFKNFENKFYKILTAFKTIYIKERIKTTYGNLKINDSLNCSWNNL